MWRLSQRFKRLITSLPGYRPYLSRYRVFREVELVTLGSNSILQLAAPCKLPTELPQNVVGLSKLPTQREPWGYSFKDVPGYHFPEIRIFRIGPAKIVTAVDEWENCFFLILTEKGEQVRVDGTGYHPLHRKVLERNSVIHSVAHACWGLEYWCGNYCHWLLFHLPKFTAINRHLMNDGIKPMVCFRSKISRVQKESLGSFMDLSRDIVEIDEGVTQVDDLYVFSGPGNHPQLLQEFIPQQPKQAIAERAKKIMISRRNSHWRRLLNEDELRVVLLDYGFECVALEELSFLQQMELFQEASCVIGVHGAGLANVVFCRTNTAVLEIGSQDFPNAEYYRLAASRGLRYRWIEATPSLDAAVGYRDLRVDINAVVESIKANID